MMMYGLYIFLAILVDMNLGATTMIGSIPEDYFTPRVHNNDSMFAQSFCALVHFHCITVRQ